MNSVDTTAVMAQLNSMKATIVYTIDAYERTEDLNTITPNLRLIQMVLDYLRSQSNVSVEVEDPNLSFTVEAPEGMNVDFAVLSNSHAVITLEALEATAEIQRKELFGEVGNAIDVAIKLPIICGRTYEVRQTNPMLAIYEGEDPSISQTLDGDWAKEKSYLITDEDILDYAFLVGPGRSSASIEVTSPDGKKITFDINTHVHFKEKAE